MKIVCKSGKVLPVDDSSIDYENEYVPCVDVVTVISEGVYLEDIWIVTCQKDLSKADFGNHNKDSELEFVAEKIFTHKPSKEELIHFMCKNGCCIDDVVQVEMAYRLEIEHD